MLLINDLEQLPIFHVEQVLPVKHGLKHDVDRPGHLGTLSQSEWL